MVSAASSQPEGSGFCPWVGCGPFCVDALPMFVWVSAGALVSSHSLKVCAVG